MTALASRLWAWLRPRLSLADDTVWAVLIGGLLVQGRGDIGMRDVVPIAGQVVALDLGRSRPRRGAFLSVLFELLVLARGDGPSIGIGFVVISLGAVFTGATERERARALALIGGACALIAFAPRVLDWPSTAVLEGSGERADAFETLAYLVGAVALRTNLIGAVRARRRAESARDTAAADERARIARELHDVVAHQMTVVVAQAQGAEMLVDHEPEQVRSALRAISATTRDALVEMRRLVDVDRDTAAPVVSTVPPDQPLPGLSFNDLGRLATTAEKAGLDVYMYLAHDHDTPVSSGVALAAHRTIQESLTNAAKHAPGSRVDVKTEESADALEVRVENGPGKGPPPDIPGSGMGLIGMRERVEFFGGTLETGPTPDGGWSVVARFPTLEAPSTSE